jgi:hypothetical protein
MRLWIGNDSAEGQRNCQSPRRAILDVIRRAFESAGIKFTHECLAIRINRKLKAINVIDVLSDLFILRGGPGVRLRNRQGPKQPK